MESVQPVMESSRLATILCCKCGTSMQSNVNNMCMTCLATEVDITEHIERQHVIVFCPKCERYLVPPSQWLPAALESPELLSVCLKRVRGLNTKGLRMHDAHFVWTEAHSKRLVIQVTVRGELQSGSVVEQSTVLTFSIHNQQCTDCTRAAAKDFWNACVQIRQRVQHKKTLLYLEQMLLHCSAHQHCNNVKQVTGGMDFFFANRSHAVAFVEFVCKKVPCRYRFSQQLKSHDVHSNTYNYKFTYAIDVAPVCKDDIVCLSKPFAQRLGNISQLAIVYKIADKIHLIDPNTCQVRDVDDQTYFSQPFTAIATARQLTEFIVVEVESSSQPNDNETGYDADSNTSSIIGKMQFKDKQHDTAFPDWVKVHQPSIASTTIASSLATASSSRRRQKRGRGATAAERKDAEWTDGLQDNDVWLTERVRRNMNSGKKQRIVPKGQLEPVFIKKPRNADKDEPGDINEDDDEDDGTASVITNNTSASVLTSASRSSTSRRTASSFGGISNKHSPVSVWVMRASGSQLESDDGHVTVHTRSHLGRLLKPGDTVLGLDLRHCNINNTEFEQLPEEKVPHVILIRKIHGSIVTEPTATQKRKWKLLRLKAKDAEQKMETDTIDGDVNKKKKKYKKEKSKKKRNLEAEMTNELPDYSEPAGQLSSGQWGTGPVDRWLEDNPTTGVDVFYDAVDNPSNSSSFVEVNPNKARLPDSCSEDSDASDDSSDAYDSGEEFAMAEFMRDLEEDEELARRISVLPSQVKEADLESKTPGKDEQKKTLDKDSGAIDNSDLEKMAVNLHEYLKGLTTDSK